jgi:DNA-binding GntR family transcriptional regulator
LIDHTRIGLVFYASRSNSDRQRVTRAADQHDAMIEALSTHSAAAAVQLTLEHWELSRNQMEQFVTPDPLPFELALHDQENSHAV